MVYKVIVTVKEIKGSCEIHEVGDTIEIVGMRMKGSVCPSAFAAIFPVIYAMGYGANFPWARTREGEDKITVCCPDPKNRVIFEIRREKTTD